MQQSTRAVISGIWSRSGPPPTRSSGTKNRLPAFLYSLVHSSLKTDAWQASSRAMRHYKPASHSQAMTTIFQCHDSTFTNFISNSLDTNHSDTTVANLLDICSQDQLVFVHNGCIIPNVGLMSRLVTIWSQPDIRNEAIMPLDQLCKLFNYIPLDYLPPPFRFFPFFIFPHLFNFFPVLIKPSISSLLF